MGRQNRKLIKNMNREELKRLWFSLPLSKKETKEIIVETEYGHV